MTLTNEQMQRVREIAEEYFDPVIHPHMHEGAVLTAVAALSDPTLQKQLVNDAERLKFQYSQYVKTCEAVGLGGVVSYEQWISAIDAARSTEGKK